MRAASWRGRAEELEKKVALEGRERRRSKRTLENWWEIINFTGMEARAMEKEEVAEAFRISKSRRECRDWYRLRWMLRARGSKPRIEIWKEGGFSSHSRLPAEEQALGLVLNFCFLAREREQKFKTKPS